MIRQVRTGLIVGAMALGVLGSASAQLMVPPGARGLAAYTGVTGPFGHQPGWRPSDWYLPQVSMQYQLPQQVVYIPVAVTMAAPRPAIEPIQTARVMLRSRIPLGEMRVKPGTVVTWTNVEDRSLTLLLEPAGLSGAGAPAHRQKSVVRVNASVSLAFNEPGVYRYSLVDRPEEQGRIIVEGPAGGMARR